MFIGISESFERIGRIAQSLAKGCGVGIRDNNLVFDSGLKIAGQHEEKAFERMVPY